MAGGRTVVGGEELKHMARMIALNWPGKGKQVRWVLASSRGSRLALEAAGTLALPSEAEGAGAALQLGELLRSELGGKAKGAVALLSVDRSQVELVSLTLPPAPDTELPELVRNQAMRENVAIGDDAELDFVPLDDDPAQPRHVTAVAISGTRLEQMRAVLNDAGLVPKAIVVRPYATAALVLDSLEDRDQTCLVVNVVEEEIDLVALSKGRIAYWRTLRQANVSQDRAAAARLAAEIQRTLVVARVQLAGQAIEAVYLCGGLDEHPALVEVLREQLPLPLTLVDPLAAHGGLDEAPQASGPLSALVGMLAVEANGAKHAIDLLHPRKQPGPPDRRRTLVLAGAAAAVVLLLGGYQVWSTFSTADEQIETLTADRDRLDDLLKQAGQKKKVIQSLRDWSKNDVNWLDELRDLSLRFPSGRDAVVLRMGLNQGRGAAGEIDVVGIVRDPIVVSHIENNLRDAYHQISSRHMQERLQENDYSWHFESSIEVAAQARPICQPLARRRQSRGSAGASGPGSTEQCLDPLARRGALKGDEHTRKTPGWRNRRSGRAVRRELDLPVVLRPAARRTPRGS